MKTFTDYKRTRSYTQSDLIDHLHIHRSQFARAVAEGVCQECGGRKPGELWVLRWAVADHLPPILLCEECHLPDPVTGVPRHATKLDAWLIHVLNPTDLADGIRRYTEEMALPRPPAAP